MQLAEGLIRSLAAATATQSLQNGKACDIPSGNPAVPVLIASQGKYSGSACTITAGQTLFVTVMMLILVDVADTSGSRQNARSWKAEMTIDALPVRDINGDGSYAMETSTMTLPVAAGSAIPADSRKQHTLIGIFPSVLIADLSKGTHALEAKYTLSGGAISTFSETITVS